MSFDAGFNQEKLWQYLIKKQQIKKKLSIKYNYICYLTVLFEFCPWRLLKGLLANGIYQNVLEAAEKGVPTGTFIIVDNPETPEQEFTVEIVPFIRRKKGDVK